MQLSFVFFDQDFPWSKENRAWSVLQHFAASWFQNWKKSAKAGLVRKLSFPAWKRPKKTSIKKTEEKEKLWRKKPFENSCCICNNSALLLAFALRKKVAQLYEEGKTLMIHLKEDVPHFPVYVSSFMLPINTKWSERVLNIQDRMLCFSIQLPIQFW